MEVHIPVQCTDRMDLRTILLGRLNQILPWCGTGPCKVLVAYFHIFSQVWVLSAYCVVTM